MWGRDCDFNIYSSHKVKISSNWTIVRREADQLPLLSGPQGMDSIASWRLKAKSWRRDRWEAREGARLYGFLLSWPGLSPTDFSFSLIPSSGMPLCRFFGHSTSPAPSWNPEKWGQALLASSGSSSLYSPVCPSPPIILYTLHKTSKQHPHGQ